MKFVSYWHDTAPVFSGGAQGPVEGHYDAAIIGGGFTGLAAARQLIALRRDAPALRLGDFVPLSLKAPLLAFERVFGKERVHFLFNLGDAPIKIAREKGRVLFARGSHQDRLEPLGVRISAFS